MKSILSASVLAAVTLAAAAHAQEPVQPRASPPFTLTTGSERAPEQLAMQFDKADLALRVFPDTRTLEGVATLDFTATAPLARIVLELDTVFTIEAIALDGQSPLPETRWRNPEGRLTIDLDRPRAAGETVSVQIAYSGPPRVAPRAPWNGGFVWSMTPGDQPWIATAVQGEGCDLFWPCIDHPLGKPGRVDLHITVPEALSAISNGRLVGVTEDGDGVRTWNWTARSPGTYAIALNIGPYVELAETYASRFGNEIPLHFWALADDPPERVAALFAELPLMLDFFEATVGPYPFADEKAGVVHTPHLGMEHQTINAYGNGYRLDGKGYDWLLQHELAHEWFGNQMTNADWDDMWLHEGLGSYMQPLYARWLNGERYMQTELATMRLALANRFPLVSGEPREAGSVYEGATGPGLDLYYKGALVAHSLRLLIGDEAFNRSLTRLVYGRPDPRPGNFSPRHATTPDFIAIVNEEAGRDLGWFFDAYLYRAELPDLEMERDGGRVTLNWRAGGPFPMPVEVEIDGVRQAVDMTDGTATLAAPARAHILLDPDNRVLRRLAFVDAYQARLREDGARRPSGR